MFDPDVSEKQNMWMSELVQKYPDLRYAIKNGEERIGPKRLKVDGYSHETETAFEFDGCYYHGCKCVKRPKLKTDEEVTAFKKLMKERHENTVEKHAYLRKFCKLEIMKECEFLPTVSQSYGKEMSSEQLLEEICNGKYFGAAVCDIRVPDHLKDYFAEMAPVFKNVEVSIDDVGPYMKNVCQKLGEFKTSRRSLIGSYFGKQIMVASPLIQWYCAHGLIVDNITAFVRYDPIPCFRKFNEEVAATGRKADVDQTGTAEEIQQN